MTRSIEKQVALGSYPTPLEKFYQNEQKLADKTCFIQPYPDGTVEDVNWQEHAHDVRKLARYLKSLGLETGSRIAILSSNCAHWIMADIAIWMSGHVSVPLYPVLTANSIRQILDHSEAKVIFVGQLDGWANMKDGIDEEIHMIAMPLASSAVTPNQYWDSILQEQVPLQENPIRAREDLATIIYTSGTTGAPKGVMHSFDTLATVGVLSGNIYDTNSTDRMLSYLPLAHVAERSAIEINQLYQEFTVYFSCSLETFADDLKRARPTLFFAVPRIWLKLHQKVLENIPAKRLRFLLKIPFISGAIQRRLTGALGLDHLRIAISGAAPLSSSLMTWYQTIGINILEGYAMSENFAYSHATRIGEGKIGFVGSPNPFVKCKLSDQGEILVNSPTNMMGYYREPELTAAVVDEGGFLRTGDKGIIEPDGRLKITGRIKEIFKTSKGKYVVPAPIENKFLASNHIEQVCVTGASLPQPIAMITLTDSALRILNGSNADRSLEHDLQKIMDRVNIQLDKHENIGVLIVFKQNWTVENGLLTPTLKVKRTALENRYGNHFETWSQSDSRVLWAD